MNDNPGKFSEAVMWIRLACGLKLTVSIYYASQPSSFSL